VRAILWAALVLGLAAKPCASQTAIASTQSHGISISLLKAEKSQYCALFGRVTSDEPMQAVDVSMEFTQQVGRIAEKPASFSASEQVAGLYCAEVDLGKHYYQPSYYHVSVHYTDSSGKRRASQFFLTVR
jgi:hypothetical protein